jgi:alanine dehydrogenase
MSTLLLGPEEVEASIEMPAVVEAVEDAFRAYAKGETIMPPKSYVELPQYNGDFRAMPAFVDEAAGLKWVNVHPDNRKEYDLPTVMGLVIYSDPRNGYPLALMDGTTLTRARTGAASAVATRYLARQDVSSLGIIGAGVQAHTQLEAIAAVREIERVVVHDQNEDRMEQFIAEESRPDVQVVAGTAREAAGCDILSTVTPVREPIVEREWLADGMHINAVGADAAGKQELDSQIILDARVVIDDWDQCSHSGEINVPVANGLIDREDIYAELGSVVAGQKIGRENEELTVFDSTGLAIQDIVTARLVYETAETLGRGKEMTLVGD